MVSLMLFGLDRLPPESTHTLAAIMAAYGAQLVAIAQGIMHVLLPASLVESFLATVSRDVLPVEIVKHVTAI
jgi:cytochrome bd-type quinol oxidase subunit 1